MYLLHHTDNAYVTYRYKALRHLDLSEGQFDSKASEFIETFIKKNFYLKVLEFSYNHRCGNKLAEAVANGLTKNPVLEIIYLDHCSIEDDGMGALIGSITQLPEIQSQLRVLRFHGNLASDNILEMMGTWCSIKRIPIILLFHVSIT